MAISNVVLRSGVGPTATIALLVTHGFKEGTSPPPTGENPHYFSISLHANEKSQGSEAGPRIWSGALTPIIHRH